MRLRRDFEIAKIMDTNCIEVSQIQTIGHDKQRVVTKVATRSSTLTEKENSSQFIPAIPHCLHPPRCFPVRSIRKSGLDANVVNILQHSTCRRGPLDLLIVIGQSSLHGTGAVGIRRVEIEALAILRVAIDQLLALRLTLVEVLAAEQSLVLS